MALNNTHKLDTLRLNDTKERVQSTVGVYSVNFQCAGLILEKLTLNAIITKISFIIYVNGR